SDLFSCHHSTLTKGNSQVQLVLRTTLRHISYHQRRALSSVLTRMLTSEDRNSSSRLTNLSPKVYCLGLDRPASCPSSSSLPQLYIYLAKNMTLTLTCYLVLLPSTYSSSTQHTLSLLAYQIYYVTAEARPVRVI